jgi:pimeloyl-ACP methyl ester carboxylesterase
MKSVLILHGAIGSQAQFLHLADALPDTYRVYTMDFIGHGRNIDVDKSLSIQKFAEQVLSFLEKESLSQVSVFGYSMGGYVAMYLAKHHPDKIAAVVTLGTKFLWNEDIAAKEVRMLDPDVIEFKLPSFASELAERHSSSWKQLLHKTAIMLTEMGQENPLNLSDYNGITLPVLIMLGDRDKMVGFEESVNVYKALPDASFAVLPATPHPIEKVDVSLLVFHLVRFFGS